MPARSFHSLKAILPLKTALAFLACSFAFASLSEAIVLNDVYFQANGGDSTSPTTVSNTLDAGYTAAKAYSKEKQFLAVGGLGDSFFGSFGCTATWLGNDVANNKTYVLTAAHCVEPDPIVAQSPITTSFTDWNGNSSGSLSGTVHLPPERVNNNSCGGGACSDIAILELNGQINIQDSQGQPVAAPLIYDGDKELGFENSFVGYGVWGESTHGQSEGTFLPPTGRAGATNVIAGFFVG